MSVEVESGLVLPPQRRRCIQRESILPTLRISIILLQLLLTLRHLRPGAPASIPLPT